MAVPKKKTSNARRDKRRSHHALNKPNWIVCSNCGEYVVPHRVCTACGYYKGKQVVAVQAD